MTDINVPRICRTMDMGEFIKRHNLPADTLDNVPEEEQPFVGITAWMKHHLPMWDKKQRSSVACELIDHCTYQGLVPLLQDINKTWNASQRQAQYDMEIVYVDKLFDFFQENDIAPSAEAYATWRVGLGARKRLFERLYQAGIVFKAQSQTAKDVWSNLLRENDSKALDVTKWLVKHKMVPDFSDMGYKPKPQTIFSVIKNKHGVEVLKLVPSEQLTPLLNTKDDKGRVAMHYAVGALLPSYVQFLIDLGASKTPQDNKGRFPLDMIKRTTSRVEHIGQIQEMLGGTTSKTPIEVLDQAIKTLDLTLLNKALVDPGISRDITNVAFRVLGHPVTNTSSSVYKKMRKRKMEMFTSMLNSIDVDATNNKGDTFLHIAISRGLPKVCDQLLGLSPSLASIKNNENLFPDQMIIKEFDQLMDVDATDPNPYSGQALLRLKQKMEGDTSKKILKMYIKHKIAVTEDSFPALQISDAGKAMFQKYLIQQSLSADKSKSNKKKM